MFCSNTTQLSLPPDMLHYYSSLYMQYCSEFPFFNTCCTLSLHIPSSWLTSVLSVISSNVPSSGPLHLNLNFIFCSFLSVNSSFSAFIYYTKIHKTSWINYKTLRVPFQLCAPRSQVLITMPRIEVLHTFWRKALQSEWMKKVLFL